MQVACCMWRVDVHLHRRRQRATCHKLQAPRKKQVTDWQLATNNWQLPHTRTIIMDLSLATWSLARLLRNTDTPIDYLDVPALVRERFGIEALELNNVF